MYIETYVLAEIGLAEIDMQQEARAEAYQRLYRMLALTGKRGLLELYTICACTLAQLLEPGAYAPGSRSCAALARCSSAYFNYWLQQSCQGMRLNVLEMFLALWVLPFHQALYSDKMGKSFLGVTGVLREGCNDRNESKPEEDM